MIKDDSNGIPLEEHNYIQSQIDDDELLMQEEEEEEQRLLEMEEYEEYERRKDEDLSYIIFEQERIERNRRLGYAGGRGCLIA